MMAKVGKKLLKAEI